ncbi:hypothetical protein [Paludisphaera mucosa]|uniref:Carboxypeptidase regulatory-like domain-containing protein n=1 Tax=Paludisphaera mucosa TaxID=3030827 RepID=A0ABT6FIE3_9BACT|nr:hypothetical protein [Paludisphaera mucosa]MDG3007325.1 hypothetical protein [Paludisphaera mucosa]
MNIHRFKVSLALLTFLGFGYLVYDYASQGDDSLQGLSGYVRIDGKPLAKGMVRFISVDATHPWAFGGYVKDGRYEVPAEYGLAPARYHVEFSSIRNDDVNKMIAARGRGEEIELKEEVPARYNLNSEVQIDLTSGSVLEADFDLR